MNYTIAKNCIRNNNKEMFRTVYEQVNEDITSDIIRYVVRGKYLQKDTHKLNLQDQISFISIVCNKLQAPEKSWILKEVISNAIEVEDFEIFKHFVQQEKDLVSEHSLLRISKKNLQKWFDIIFVSTN